MTVASTSGAVVVACPEFGPFDALADEVHGDYVAGMFDEAAQTCLRWVTLTRAAGDETTTRYLLYVRAIALQEAGRKSEAIDAAHVLLASLGDAPEPVWRAKALAVIGEASAELNDHAAAVAALAEADWHVQQVLVGTYGHLSASMAVALALRSINLLEQADELLSAIRGGDRPDVDVLVMQQLAVHSAFWGASLRLIGRETEARQHFVDALSRANRMRRVARRGDLPRMVARAQVIEAYAAMHLGDLPLAAARAEEGAAGFDPRPELTESHLLQMVRARAEAAAGDHGGAVARLEELVRDTTQRGREVWAMTARAMLADVHGQTYGPHPGQDMWREIAHGALRKVWAEREARFNSLQDQHQLRELTAEAHRISRAVAQDALTGLGNRRALDHSLDVLAGPRWAVFVDLDDFKRVNDVWSHAIGDEVLRAVADVLRAQSRRADVLVRYGGDEFVVLPEGDRESAVALAERIRTAVRDFPWSSIAEGLEVTVSVGVGGGTAGDHLAAADAALLEAKRGGRDRVAVG